MLPARSVNKGCCGHQTISHYSCPTTASPEGTQDGDKQAAHHQAISHCSCPKQCTLRGFRMAKNRILALDSYSVYQRNDFNELRLLHLPILRKELNSLTSDVWFSLINNHLLLFQLPGFCCKNSSISWLLPYLLGAVPQSYLRG